VVSAYRYSCALHKSLAVKGRAHGTGVDLAGGDVGQEALECPDGLCGHQPRRDH
jgi:hypothetical protein